MGGFARFMALFLCAALLFAILAGCASDEDSSVTESKALTDTETTVAEEETLTPPDIPQLDLEGRDFTIFTSDWYGYDPLNIKDIVADDLNGDMLNDAIYNRYKYVNDYFNCNIVYLNKSLFDVVPDVQKAVAAGDAAYDSVITRATMWATVLTSKMLYNLDTVPYINYDDPWYDSNSLQALSVLGKNYGIVSDLTMNLYLLVFSAYINLQIMQDYSLGNIYDIVREGSWTLDKLTEMSRAVAADINGDGKYTTEDQYGMTWIVDVPEGLINAAGIRYGTFDSSGRLQITYDTEEAITVMQKVFDFISDTELFFNVHARSTQAFIDEVGMFASGRVLCSIAGVYYAPQFRDMDNNFGIIPLPKLNTDQKEYNSPLFSNIIPILVVPITNSKLDETGAILTMMSYLGRRDMYPALYDNLLQGKITRDENSNAMLDLLFENKFYDPGIIFFNAVKDNIRNIYMNLRGDFVSTLTKTQKMTQKVIDDLEQAVQQNG